MNPTASPITFMGGVLIPPSHWELCWMEPKGDEVATHPISALIAVLRFAGDRSKQHRKNLWLFFRLIFLEYKRQKQQEDKKKKEQ